MTRWRRAAALVALLAAKRSVAGPRPKATCPKAAIAALRAALRDILATLSSGRRFRYPSTVLYCTK